MHGLWLPVHARAVKPNRESRVCSDCPDRKRLTSGQSVRDKAYLQLGAKKVGFWTSEFGQMRPRKCGVGWRSAHSAVPSFIRLFGWMNATMRGGIGCTVEHCGVKSAWRHNKSIRNWLQKGCWSLRQPISMTWAQPPVAWMSILEGSWMVDGFLHAVFQGQKHQKRSISTYFPK